MGFKSEESKAEKEAKKQLIENTAVDIYNIQIAGQVIRGQIDEAKQQMIADIQGNSMQNMSDDILSAMERSKLIKQMGEAAKAGNLAEMQRIKKLLKE